MSTSSLGMITSPGVAEVLEDMTMVEMLFSPEQAVLLPPGRAGGHQELNLKKVFQLLEPINCALRSMLL